MNYIVSFDINRDTSAAYKETHQKLTDLLRALKGHRLNFSVWTVSTFLGPRTLYKILERQLDQDDSLVVAVCPPSLCKVKNPLEEPPPSALRLLLPLLRLRKGRGRRARLPIRRRARRFAA
jgi:hypothetical protein